jgi:hypothetical protein
MGISLTQAQEVLESYRTALLKVTSGAQAYTIAGPDGSRTFTFAQLAEIEAGITKWERRVSELSSPTGRGARMRRVIPV